MVLIFLIVQQLCKLAVVFGRWLIENVKFWQPTLKKKNLNYTRLY